MIAFKAGYLLLLALAAFSDARRFRIPNIYPLLLVLLAVAAWLAGFPFAAPLWSHLLHFAVALAVGMLLFHFGWFGGGDVKLYAALALWYGFSDAPFLLMIVAISGVLVVAGSMIFRLLRTAFGRAEKEKVSLMKRRIAYGLAIAAGGAIALFRYYP